MPVGVKKHTVLRAQSNIIITDGGIVQEYDCVHCCHCQKVMKVGASRDQEFRYTCMGPVCGTRRCQAGCVPVEQRLEMAERFATPM